jgi:hypothetical protein
MGYIPSMLTINAVFRPKREQIIEQMITEKLNGVLIARFSAGFHLKAGQGIPTPQTGI